MAAQNKFKILLQGGTLLIHNDDNHVIPTTSDILVDGSVIAKIQKTIKSDADTIVIQCHGKIVSPGFVDTHRHLYQTQMKGKHASHTLLEYFPGGLFVAGLYNPTDLFWGQLAGAIESIDAGTTTVVDHSTCNNGPEFPPAAVQALLTSGLRTIYCFTPVKAVKSWDPWDTEDMYFCEQSRKSFRELALAAPYDDRVYVGHAIDNLHMPADVIKAYYADLRDPIKGKAKIITSHAVGGPIFGGAPTAAQILSQHELLGPDILLSHVNFPPGGDAELFAASGAHLSTTPNTELQMGLPPIALQPEHYHHSSLGVDCHSWGSASMPLQMNLLLQYARCKQQEELAKREWWSRHTGFTTEQVFNLGTIGGAKAVGMGDEIGRIKEGMKADLVVFDNQSPNMLAAAEEDPVAAIVLHSTARDVELVMVGGIVRKAEGKISDMVVAPAPGGVRGPVRSGHIVSWKDISAEVLQSRKTLKAKLANIDMKKGEDYAMGLFHMNKKGLLEEQNAQ